PVYAKQIQDMTNQERDQFMSGSGSIPLKFEGEIAYSVLHQGLELAALAPLAQKYGVAASDADIDKELQTSADTQLMQARFQMMQSGLIKPTATDADFNEAFKKQTGKTPDQAKADYLAQVRKELQDKSKRA